jgi:hypothetical protein
MEENQHVLELLQNSIKALKKEEIGRIKELSNQTIHSASVYQDPDNINIAVILYALSKILERKKTNNIKGWNDFLKCYIKCLENAVFALKRNDIEVYRDQINQISKKIDSLSGELKKYIRDIFRKAQINKASKIYEHGISMEKTARILGLSIWELNEYIGQSSSGDLSLTYTKEIKQRLKEARDIFQ